MAEAGQVQEIDTKATGIGTLLNQTDSELAKSLGLEYLVEQPEDETTQEVEDDIQEEVVEPKKEIKPIPKKVPVREPVKEEVKEVVKEEEKDEGEAEEEEEAEGTEEEKPDAEKDESEEGHKLLTSFVLRQGNDEVEIPTDLTLTFKAAGKDRVDIPLDKVVLMAQMGYHNEEREEKYRATEEIAAETSEKNETLTELVMHMREEFINLLSDEEYREAAVDEYQKSNSPESRARRAEEGLRQERTTRESQRQSEQATSYVATQIYPVMKQLPKEFPSVSEDEVLGRFNRLVTPLLRNGTVPYAKLPEVKRLVENDLKLWAQSLHLERDSAHKKTANIVKGEKTKTTLAKRQAARAVQPAGKAAKETRKPRTYASANEWAEKGLDDILGVGS
jgi:hypothetical protein